MARMRTWSPRAGLAGNQDTAWGFLGDLQIDPAGPGNSAREHREQTLEHIVICTLMFPEA